VGAVEMIFDGDDDDDDDDDSSSYSNTKLC